MRNQLLISLALTATCAVAQNPATYSLYGQGCNGSPELVCAAQNDTNPTLAGNTYPNEYCHAVLNTSASPVTVVGFSLYTATTAGTVGTIETVMAGVYRDASGAGATAHTTPDLNPTATGSLAVDGNPGWYRVNVYPPVVVGAGEAFWIGAESITVQVPDDSTGAAGVAPSFWRRPPQGGTAWAQTGLVNNPIFRVHCAGSTDIPVLTNSGVPQFGATMNVDLTASATALAGFMVLGFDDTQWLGMPTPVNLASFGMPNCAAYTDVAEAFFVAASGGSATYPFSIPNQPSLAGLEFFNQWVVIDPTASTPAGFLASNAGKGTIGT